MTSFVKVIALLKKLDVESFQSNEEINDTVLEEEEELLDSIVKAATKESYLTPQKGESFWDVLASKSLSPSCLVNFCSHMFKASTSTTKFNAAKFYLMLWSLEGSTIYSIFSVSTYREALNILKMFAKDHDTQG